MNFDKNTVVGSILLGILFLGFFWYTNKQNMELMKDQQRIKDSVARIDATKAMLHDTLSAKSDSLKADTAKAIGGFSVIGKEQLTIVENNLMKITFTNKGGKVKSVELKNYKSYNGKFVILGNESDRLGYPVNADANTSLSSNDLFFIASPVQKNNDSSQTISFSISDAQGHSIKHEYRIKPDEYMIDWNMEINGADRLLSGNTLNLQWNVQPIRHEAEGSYAYERLMSNVCFYEDNSFDYISTKKEKQFEKPVQWLGVVQQFFNTTIIAKNNFSGGQVQWKRSDDSSNLIGQVDAQLQVKLPATASVNVPFQLFYGPNDFKILKKQAEGMDKMVNLGRDAYAFVRPINRFIIMPVFDFFAGFVKNFGWVIMLLTIVIRLVTSPLTYSSYLSGAKMKVLKPELEALKKKFGTDQQGYAMEQMKLYKEAGVNPLGGCIPALLQIPIFFALYSFFNSNIALRGQPFLWCHDLSQYDVIARLPFSVPLGFGDHISLFTITAVITSFFISIYNMASTPTQDNPAMKYMPYFFPFMMLFYFNRLPAALTWYYTVSNTLTLLLQLVIQKYIINHDNILAKIDLKRKTPKSKSKWQSRYEQVMDSQKKLQDMKDRTNQNKK